MSSALFMAEFAIMSQCKRCQAFFSDYAKVRNYWKWIRNKLKQEGSQLGSGTTQLKLQAATGTGKSAISGHNAKELKKIPEK
jgi:hypothetical protein